MAACKAYQRARIQFERKGCLRCPLSVPLGPAKMLRPSHLCSLSAGLTAFVRLPLSPGSGGLCNHGYRVQGAGVPERQRAWRIGSAPLMAPPLSLVTVARLSGQPLSPARHCLPCTSPSFRPQRQIPGLGLLSPYSLCLLRIPVQNFHLNRFFSGETPAEAPR
jgi:hypothetical protein